MRRRPEWSAQCGAAANDRFHYQLSEMSQKCQSRAPNVNLLIASVQPKPSQRAHYVLYNARSIVVEKVLAEELHQPFMIYSLRVLAFGIKTGKYVWRSSYCI